MRWEGRVGETKTMRSICVTPLAPPHHHRSPSPPRHPRTSPPPPHRTLVVLLHELRLALHHLQCALAVAGVQLLVQPAEAPALQPLAHLIQQAAATTCSSQRGRQGGGVEGSRFFLQIHLQMQAPKDALPHSPFFFLPPPEPAGGDMAEGLLPRPADVWAAAAGAAAAGGADCSRAAGSCTVSPAGCCFSCCCCCCLASRFRLLLLSLGAVGSSASCGAAAAWLIDSASLGLNSFFLRFAAGSTAVDDMVFF